MKRHRKIAEPYFKKSHGSWYVNWGGKQVRLGKDRDQSFAQYELMRAEKLRENPELDVIEELPVGLDDPLVVDIIAEFVAHHEANSKPGTVEFYKSALIGYPNHRAVPFVSWLKKKRLGHMKVSQLRAHHVTRWLAECYTFKLGTEERTSGSYRANLIRAVKAAFNWADAEEKIARLPLRKLKKPQVRSRDVYLTPEQWAKLIDIVKKSQASEAFLDAIITLRETGCRPQELRTVEARHFDRDGRCWVFPADEAKGQREPRVVLLNDTAFAITQRLALKYPKGPLFRNRLNRAWHKDALALRCRRLCTEHMNRGKLRPAKLDFPVCPYAIRHTFATDAIIRGVDLQTIATLMGHRDLKMLSRFYQHLNKRADHLRAALDRATGAA